MELVRDDYMMWVWLGVWLAEVFIKKLAVGVVKIVCVVSFMGEVFVIKAIDIIHV